MILTPERLAAALGRGPLAPVFLLHGEEPLQRVESADLLRAAARAAGAEERLRFDAATGIDWPQLMAESMSLSLFASRRLIEIDLGRKKPDRAAQEHLKTLVESAGEDVCVISVDTLSRDDLNAPWCRVIDARGVLVPCKLPEGGAFREWLQKRAGSRGRTLATEVVDLLLARTEGNLLAAAQEIDLLALLVPQREVGLEDALGAVGDSARYDVYKVVDSALAGDGVRALRMLRGVRDEGSDPIVISWSAGRELRTLSRLAGARNLEAGFAAERVWPSRQPLLRRALQRLQAAQIDRLLRESVRIDLLAKGMGTGDAWEELESLLVAVAGGPWLGVLAAQGHPS